MEKVNRDPAGYRAGSSLSVMPQLDPTQTMTISAWMSVTRELRRRLSAERSIPQFDPCLPRPAAQPPAGPGWIHEIKHDGFRILAHRSGRSIRPADAQRP